MFGGNPSDRLLWPEGACPAPFAPLAAKLETDVCVVGAGIAGLVTAYLLSKNGRSVVVLDDGVAGAGQTQRTSAHLSWALDDRFAELEKIHGAQGVRLAAESHRAAVDCIERIVREEGIECEFARVPGHLFLGEGAEPGTLDRELSALRRAGVGDVEKLERTPFAGYDAGPCLRFAECGQFHPLKFLDGLVAALRRMGARLYTAHVAEIHAGAPVKLGTREGHDLTAIDVVVATNSPVNNLFVPHLKQAPYVTYVIAAPVAEAELETGLYWDCLDPYHYVRVERAGDETLLIAGGEDHKTGEPADPARRHAALERWARARFPSLGEVRNRWSGQVFETFDGLGFIGRNPGEREHVYICTGDSGMGLTHGTIAGMLITDLMAGRINPWADLYDPARKPLRAIANAVPEDVHMALKFGEWLTPGDKASADEIGRGEGAVLRRGLAKRAVFRDAQGVLHECSAVCPHLGCVVQWNNASKTWDCPCHGSRFDPYGTVINGPANRNLAGAKVAEAETA